MRWIPALSFIALTTFFVEFVVGRSIISYLDPATFIFLFIGYGLVILVMRELAVRFNLGLRGLLLWGLAYGIINEGLLAKTMIMSVNLPVNLYDGYGVVGGISAPWSIAIATWHAFASVLFPILIIHELFPKEAKERWMGKWTPYVLGVMLFALCTAVFFGPQPNVAGTPGQYVAFLVIMGTLFALGLLFKGELRVAKTEDLRRPMLLGFSVIVPFWMLAFIALTKQPVAFFFGALIIVAIIYLWIITRNNYNSLPAFLFFALGWYCHNALQALIIVLFQNPVIAIITLIVNIFLLSMFYWKIKK